MTTAARPAAAPSHAVMISRAAFQSLFESLRPSSIAEYEKRTSCVSEFFISPYRVASVPCWSISSSGSMPVFSDFDMRRPSRASTVEWMTTSRERDLAEQLEPAEDHPVLPEADDLARGRLQVPGIEVREVRRLVGPAERREGPQRRREPGVEHVGLARQLRRAALGARRRLGLLHRQWPSGQYQTGIWWPHQICREMYQSGAFSSESIAKRCWLSGWKTTSPLAQRLRAAAA